MHKQIVLPENIWTKMNLAWGIFFAVLGAINLGVAYTCTTATWVNFKLFGIMGIMLVFIVLQALLMAPYIKDNAPAAEK